MNAASDSSRSVGSDERGRNGAKDGHRRVLIIGNESCRDAPGRHLAFLAKELNEVGIRLREARVIPDDAEIIVNTVNEVRRAFD